MSHSESLKEHRSISSESLAALEDHHVIIASTTGNLFKIRQEDIPKIGTPVPEGDPRLAIVRKTPGGLIQSGEEETSSYYALNCTAFSNIPPADYEFPDVELSNPDDVTLPDLPLVVIPIPDITTAQQEGRPLLESEKVAFLLEPEQLRDYEWKMVGHELLDSARTFVVSAIRHGMAMGLFPAVDSPTEDEQEFIFCYCLNCRAFQQLEEPRIGGRHGDV